MNIRKLILAAPWIWAAIILCLYAIPGYKLQYSEPFDLIRLDKLAHVLMFLILAFLSVFGAKCSTSLAHRPAWLIGLIGLVYGGLLEAFQGQWFVQRTTDWNDFIANSIGCFVGFTLAQLLSKALIRKLLSP